MCKYRKKNKNWPANSPSNIKSTKTIWVTTKEKKKEINTRNCKNIKK